MSKLLDRVKKSKNLWHQNGQKFGFKKFHIFDGHWLSTAVTAAMYQKLH